MEIVEGYFAMGKSSKALVVAVDHNTSYSNVTDAKAGHLWGDGAAVLVCSKERIAERDFEVIDLFTGGAACVGKALTGVNLLPNNEGIIMQNGRDVFIHACSYMASTTTDILKNNGYTLEDMDFLITHQANLRITKHVVKEPGNRG